MCWAPSRRFESPRYLLYCCGPTSPPAPPTAANVHTLRLQAATAPADAQMDPAGAAVGAGVELLLPQLARLEVTTGSAGSYSHGSDPQTPVESPQTLEGDLRDWLNAALNAAATNPKVYVKMLVSNAAAGSIIGKGGGNINDFQQKTYAKIQLSKASEYFPGTVERILMLTGRLKQVVAALSLTFSKLSKEGVAPLSPRSKAAAMAAAAGGGLAGGPPTGPAASLGSSSEQLDQPQQQPEEQQQPHQQQQPREPPAGLHLLVKLLVPQSLCGIIIGRSGATIRQFAADTQTNIKVTAADGPSPPLSHRIVTVTGEQDGVLKAIALLTLKMSEDHKYALFNTLPVASAASSAGSQLGAMPPVSAPPGAIPIMASPYHGGGGGGQMQALPHFMAVHSPPGGHMYAALQMAAGGGFTSLSISLTEEQGNFLLGQDGRGAADVAQASGVRVKVEKDPRLGGRGQYRKLVLSGSPDAVQFAQWLLSQKLAMATAAVTGYAAAGAAMAAGGLLPPAYMQQQVAGTTYFQPVAMPQAPYPGQGMPPPGAWSGMNGHSPLPPQHMGPPPPPPAPMRMVALGMPGPVPLRSRAPA